MGRNLEIASTHFQHKEIHKGTWTSPDGRTINQIDHVLVEAKDRKCIKDVRTYRGPNINSDHFLVGTKLTQKVLHWVKNKRKSRHKKAKQLEIRDEVVKENYKKQIKEEFRIQSQVGSIEEKMKETEETIKNAVDKQGTNIQHRKKEWYDADCEKEVKEKNKLRSRMLQVPNEVNKRNYRAQVKKCETVCKQKKRKYQVQLLEEIEEEYVNKEIRNFYQGVKRVKMQT